MFHSLACPLGGSVCFGFGFRLAGAAVIGGQYYRWFTGLLLHVNLFHLLVNSIAIYCVGVFLKGQVGAGKLFLFSAAAAFAANGVFAVVYPQSESVGGSPVVFASIGLILAMQVLSKKGPRFSLQPAYGKWIAGYAVLGNIPVFSGNISTLIIHSIAFVLGAAAGAAAIKLASLKMDKQIQPRQE